MSESTVIFLDDHLSPENFSLIKATKDSIENKGFNCRPCTTIKEFAEAVRDYESKPEDVVGFIIDVMLLLPTEGLSLQPLGVSLGKNYAVNVEPLQAGLHLLRLLLEPPSALDAYAPIRKFSSKKILLYTVLSTRGFHKIMPGLESTFKNLVTILNKDSTGSEIELGTWLSGLK